MSPVRPGPGMHLFYLEDSGVLFSEPRQELFLLNPSATLVWSLLEEGLDAAAIARALCTDYGVADERSAQAVVSAALEGWRDKGFLDGSRNSPPAAPAANPAKPAEGPPWPGPATHAVRHYRLLDSRFTVRFSTEAQVDAVAPVLQHLASEPDSDRGTSIDIFASPDRVLIYRNGAWYTGCPGIDALAPIVKSCIWMTVVREHRYFLNIHAGVVSDGDGCLMLPARAGSGKSTLTAALVHEGYEFFSDEIALLESGTLSIFPVPLAICVKHTGIAALVDRYPVLRTLAVHARGDGKCVTYMPPPLDRLPTTMSARPARAIVFPKYAAGSETTLLPVPRAEALQQLLGECMAVAEPLDAARVERLVQWIGAIPCYRLTFGGLDDAIAAVQKVFAPA